MRTRVGRPGGGGGTRTGKWYEDGPETLGNGPENAEIFDENESKTQEDEIREIRSNVEKREQRERWQRELEWLSDNVSVRRFCVQQIMRKIASGRSEEINVAWLRKIAEGWESVDRSKRNEERKKVK